jgi:putative prophage lp2 protein 4
MIIWRFELIKSIKFEHYRKLKEIELHFSKGINIISGTNGTCKTSVLHIISNSFKEPIKKECMKVIRVLNNNTNPKIETLTKGDKKYVDPAIGTAGTLYKAEYYNGRILEFRRKNDKELEKIKKRFRIIPKYSKGKKEFLPEMPVIYMGLTRLMSSGEIDENDFKKKKDSLPLVFQQEIAKIYQDLTGQAIDVSTYKIMQFNEMKTRAEFQTDNDGIDSNTISDGQDNLHMILTALISLKYYYKQENNESILLIDEIDATLHPDLQLKLLKILKKYSDECKIQIIFTTHSLDLLEEGLKREYYNVIYIDDDIEKVKVLNEERLDIYNIKSRLYEKSMEDIMKDKYIPIYTEDNEARIFLDMILNYFADIFDEFARIRNYFYLADSYIGCDNMEKLFKDKICGRQFKNCIGVLDGDVSLDEKSFANNLMKLPGNDSVESLVFKYSKELFENNESEFWDSESVMDTAITRIYYRDHILKEIEEIPSKIAENPERKERELNKKCFNKENNITFFELVLKYWIKSPDNKKELDYFYNGITTLYEKTAELNGINRKLLKRQ